MQFSLIFLHDIVSSKLTILLIICQFLTSVKYVKLHSKIKIPWKKANSVVWLKIPRPAENYGH